MNNKSDYIIYIDESGDHGLNKIDPDYPVFVLSFCCFKIDDYINNVVPLVQKLKFKYFGHDQVILHEHHIRKQKGDFTFLRLNKELRNDFLKEVTDIISYAKFEIFSVVIDKSKLKSKYTSPHNPYDLGMRFGLERVYDYLLSKGQEDKEVHFVFEKRGKKEDDLLELEFRRICDENSNFGYRKINFNKMFFKPLFSDKRINATGLQLADLTARPIGINYLRPNQSNRAYEIVQSKIRATKIFP